MTDHPILHEYGPSGNCYKIRLTASHCGVVLDRRHYDILSGETRTPAFLTNINANGRIPVLQLGSRFLPESNAACVYLAQGSTLIPQDRFDHADMLHWMFWEQYNHEPNIATLRFWRSYVGDANLNEIQRSLIPIKQEAGEVLLPPKGLTVSRGFARCTRVVIDSPALDADARRCSGPASLAAAR